MPTRAHVTAILARRDGFSAAVEGTQRKQLMDEIHGEMETSAVQDALKEAWSYANKDHNAGLTQTEVENGYMRVLPRLTGTQTTEREVILLSKFTESNPAGLVRKRDFEKGVAIWKLMFKERENWLNEIHSENENGIILDSSDIQPLMIKLNGIGDEKLSAAGVAQPQTTHLESDWVIEVAANIANSDLDWEAAVLLAISTWVMNAEAHPDEGLIREKLVERLLLEDTLGKGCMKFVNLMLIFFFCTRALTAAAKSPHARGIRGNLVTQFALDTNLTDIKTVSQVSEYLAEFSRQAAVMAPLSNFYFDSGAELRLLNNPMTFSEPERLPEINLWLGKSFTFQAWVSLSSKIVVPPAEGLPIFRRALAAAGEGSDLSCLSWNFPPSLDFGAHDFGGSDGMQQEHEEALYPIDESRRPAGQVPSYEEYDRLVLHTMVVDGYNVTFYQDDAIIVHQVTLSRFITNCQAALTTIGSDGLTLAMMTYNPRALSVSEITEVYSGGDMLSAAGYLVQPTTVSHLDYFGQLVEDIDLNHLTMEEMTAEQSLSFQSDAAMASSLQTYDSVETPLWPESTINTALATDPVLGYTVVGVFEGPGISDGPSQLNRSTSFPKFEGDKGITVSLWTRMTSIAYVISRNLPDCSGEQCSWSGFSDVCWGLFTYPGKVEVSNPLSYEWSTIASMDATVFPDLEVPMGVSLRHVVAVIDPNITQKKCDSEGSCVDLLRVTLCIDGICEAHDAPLQDCEWNQKQSQRQGSNLSAAIAQSQVWLKDRPPGNAWPLKDEVANIRVYDRALSEAEVWRLFQEDPDPLVPGRTLREERGCRTPDEFLDDDSWRDEFGNTCLWYQEARVAGRKNCEAHAEARERCMVACRSAERCLGSSAEGTSMRLWTQQVEIRSKGTWGTVCLAKSTTPAKEAIQCGKNAVVHQVECNRLGVERCEPVDCSEHEGDEQALLQCLGDVTWTSLGESGRPFLPCRAIVEAYEPACDWDDSTLGEVAAAVHSNQEWSLEMWFEAVRGDGCQRPDIRLINGRGATFARLMTGPTESVAPALDPPGGSGCYNDPGDQLHFDLFRKNEGVNSTNADATVLPSYSVPKPGDKHLLVIGRLQNCGVPGLAGIGLRVDGNSNIDCYDPSSLTDLEPDASFLRAIAFMGNLRVSPITLASKWPPEADSNAVRYGGVREQELRTGASPPQQRQMEGRLSRAVRTFKEKTLLVAPPLLMQTRLKSQPCDWEFADEVLDSFVRVGRGLRCDGVYTCPSFSSASIYQCPGDQEDGMFFGILPRQFEGQDRYVEFLQTITDIPVLVRDVTGDGQRTLVESSRFLDTLTEEVQVRAVFFAPVAGITTALTLTFSIEADGLSSTYSVEHIVALIGDDLLNFEVLIAVSLIFQLAIVIQLIFEGRTIRAHRRIGKHVELRRYVTLILHCCIATLTVTSSAVLLYTASTSEAHTKDLVGAFVDQDWGSSVRSEEKLTTLLGSLENLIGHLRWKGSIETLAMGQALLIFLGVLLTTNLHPRVALITSTLEHAVSDMFHFFVIFVLVLFCFAIVGTWRFGGYRDDMSTLTDTMWTQIDAILGPPGSLGLSEAALLNYEFVIYVVLLHGLNFFFLVNFFLAIIVNGYTRYSEGTESTDVENDIFSDIGILLFSSWYRIRYGWSSNQTMALAISELPSTFIAVEHLKHPRFSHVFPDNGSVEAFHDFYSTWVGALTTFGEGQAPENDVRTLVLALESRQNVRLTRAELVQSEQVKHMKKGDGMPILVPRRHDSKVQSNNPRRVVSEEAESNGVDSKEAQSNGVDIAI